MTVDVTLRFPSAPPPLAVTLHDSLVEPVSEDPLTVAVNLDVRSRRSRLAPVEHCAPTIGLSLHVVPVNSIDVADAVPEYEHVDPSASDVVVAVRALPFWET